MDLRNPTPAAEAIAAKFRQPEPEITRPHDARIGFKKDTAGRELFDFPARKKSGQRDVLDAIRPTIFGGIGAGIMYGNGPWLLAIPFEFVGGLLVIGASMTLLKGRSIHILQDAVELAVHARFQRRGSIPAQHDLLHQISIQQFRRQHVLLSGDLGHHVIQRDRRSERFARR